MKDSKAKKPSPNLKNKDFVQWIKAESCKKEDNIVSTDWHEKLKRLQPFSPVYDNKPLSMIYLLSGEYGRIWQKERDEWYKSVFVPQGAQQDMENRKKKVRQEARAAKKAAEISAKERKERRAKELEAKAKAKAEEAEKLKERVRKLAAPKLPLKAPKKKKPEKGPPEEDPERKTQPDTTEKSEICPKGMQPVELTIQCECSSHDTKGNEETKKEQPSEAKPTTPTTNSGCVMCEKYLKQLNDVHETNVSANETNAETQPTDEEVQ